jgi:hypothetical protein
LSLKYLRELIKETNYRIEYQDLFVVFISLTYIIHVAGCLWYAAHYGKVNNYENWITTFELKDDNMLIKYIYSLYWATVTCTTVGYGDILPMNGFELFWAVIIIVFGVAIFSFVLSDLSSKFSELTKTKRVSDEKVK